MSFFEGISHVSSVVESDDNVIESVNEDYDEMPDDIYSDSSDDDYASIDTDDYMAVSTDDETDEETDDDKKVEELLDDVPMVEPEEKAEPVKEKPSKGKGKKVDKVNKVSEDEVLDKSFIKIEDGVCIENAKINLGIIDSNQKLSILGSRVESKVIKGSEINIFENTVIIGNIECDTLIIKGENIGILGNLSADFVDLDGDIKIKGDIHTNRLDMGEDVKICGSCVITGSDEFDESIFD